MTRGEHIQIAVISDVHGNLWALKAVLSDIRARKIEKIVNLGDCLYGPLDPAGTAEILMELDIPTVSGNEDRIVVNSGNPHASTTLDFVRKSLSGEQLIWLKGLPHTAEILNDFYAFHGTPEKNTEYLILDIKKRGITIRENQDITAKLQSITSKIILCGHDHTPNIILLTDGRLIINPGSVGLQAYTDDQPFPHTIETGSPHARYSVITKSEAGYAVESIAIPYDWETPSGTARRNGRDDWAEWLKTGRAGF